MLKKNKMFDEIIYILKNKFSNINRNKI